MRKLFRRGIATLMVLAMLLAMGTTAIAAEGKTVEVKEIMIDFEYTEEMLQELPVDFTITNVLEKIGTLNNSGTYADIYEVEAPSTITLTGNNAAYFGVVKVYIEGNIYYLNFDEELPIKGQMIVMAPDESGAVDEYGYPLMVEKVIDASEFDKYPDDFPVYLPGCTVTLTEPGYYGVEYVMHAAGFSTQAIIKVKDSSSQTTEPSQPVEPTAPVTVTANPASSKVLVNGVEKSFEAYNINGNNYFKLRDLASVVNGTEKQFNVEWDNVKKAINLVSDKAYTAVGGEMTVGDGLVKTGTLNTAKIYKDGVEIQLTAYNINGNNYFKLRDITQAFNIGVTWDNQTKTVGIDTAIDYVAE